LIEKQQNLSPKKSLIAMCENPPKRIDEKVQKPRLIGSVVSRKPTPTSPQKMMALILALPFS